MIPWRQAIGTTHAFEPTVNTGGERQRERIMSWLSYALGAPHVALAFIAVVIFVVATICKHANREDATTDAWLAPTRVKRSLGLQCADYDAGRGRCNSLTR